ncbi:MAG: class I tRNA ligase family protein [Bryobacterales bacterium]
MSTAKFLQAKPIVDFPAVEREIAELWRAQNTFEKSLENRKGRPQFTFYEGPPTANGLPHNGHVLTRVFKDVFLRYQTMRGKYVPARPAGIRTVCPSRSKSRRARHPRQGSDRGIRRREVHRALYRVRLPLHQRVGTHDGEGRLLGRPR